MLSYTLKEHSSIGIMNILNSLGYMKLAQSGSGRNSDIAMITEKAISRFKRKNKEYLAFLGLSITDKKIVSSGKAGAIPLEYALGSNEKANLTVEPMINWQTMSDFASVTKDRSWLSIKQEWEISKVLDIELWYFSKPFLTESLNVLRRPAKGFKTYESTESYPKGNTNWIDYAVNKYPYRDISFSNTNSISTYDVLPHSILLWCLNKIYDSIINIVHVPADILSEIDELKSILGSNILPLVPTKNNLNKLPKSGAWAGYLNLYNEIEHIAILSGVLNEDKTRGCAYSIQTEKLFEEFTIYICEQFAINNGFKIYKDTDDSSRIGLKQIGDSKFTMLSSLRPDIAFTSNDTLIIIDSKYKRHYDLANTNSSKENDWYQEMRNDLHQVICYNIFSQKPKKLFLLTHPKISSGLEFNIWRTNRDKNCIVGFLPIKFDNESQINKITKVYEKNLNLILANFI